MISFNILGCCVTRMAMTALIEKFPDKIKVNQYVSSTNPISLCSAGNSRRIEPDELNGYDLSNFRKRCVCLDNNKESFNYLFEQESDYLIIDIMDSRILMIEKDSCYVTLSSPFNTIKKENLKFGWDKYNTVNIFRDITDEQWNSAINTICEKALEHYSLDRIIINEAYGIRRYLDPAKGAIHSFSEKDVAYMELYNPLFLKLNKILRNNLKGCHVIEFPDNEKTICNKEHLFGLHTLHYWDEYYDYAAQCIETIINEMSPEEEKLALKKLKYDYEIRYDYYLLKYQYNALLNSATQHNNHPYCPGIKKVIVFGIDNDYNAEVNLLMYEISKGNIEVIGISSYDKKYMNFLDGFKVYTQSELFNLNYDYVIVFHSAYQAVVNNLTKLGVERTKIINGKVFNTPYFDFILYTNLLESPLTIFSDDCWGGLVYHYLYLPINSPTVNLWFNKSDFLKFVSDYQFYLNCELKCERETDIFRCQIALGSLGEGDKKITMMLNHHACFADAAADWNKRKDRVNKNNIFVKMSNETGDPDLARRFEQIPLEKKAIFTPTSFPQCSSSIFMPRYIQRCLNDAMKSGVSTFAAYVRSINEISKSIDLLKLLNGMPDFRRDS